MQDINTDSLNCPSADETEAARQTASTDALPRSSTGDLNVTSRHMHALLFDDFDYETWDACIMGTCAGGNSICDPIIRADGETGISLRFVVALAPPPRTFHAMLANIVLREAVAGEHTQDSLDYDFSLCVGMIPRRHRMDVRLMHEFFKIKQPFSLWIARMIKRFKMRLGREYIRPLPGALYNGRGRSSPPSHTLPFSMTPLMAMSIALGIGTRRGVGLLRAISPALEWMEPDPAKRWQRLEASFNQPIRPVASPGIELSWE